MNQSPAYPSTPPAKKSNKKGIAIGVVVLVLCGSCFVLASLAAAGYYYFQTVVTQNSSPASGLNPAQNEPNPSSDQASKELEEIKQSGVGSIPLTLTVPDGMRVVKQVSLVAPNKDHPELCNVYVAALLENTTAVIGINLDFKVWQKDAAGGPTTLRNTSSGDKRLVVIPLHQTGVLLWQNSGFQIQSIPVKVEMTLTAIDKSQPMNAGVPASMEALQNTTLPNPFFKVTSAEIVANQQPSGNLYDIEANGKYINNLPMKNYAMGLFLFYDENGKIIGFADSSWSRKPNDGSDGIVDPQGEGQINGPLPYRLAVKPAKVELYTYMDFGSTINLQKINK